jgi:hypothetical protein
MTYACGLELLIAAAVAWLWHHMVGVGTPEDTE